MTMSTADRQVIEMANRPRERLDRMERRAYEAMVRRRVRRVEQEEKRTRRAVIIDRLLCLAVVTGGTMVTAWLVLYATAM